MISEELSINIPSTTTLAKADLVFAICGAHADGIADFYAIQREYGYESAPYPAHWQPPVTNTRPVTVHRLVFPRCAHGKIIKTGIHQKDATWLDLSL